MAGDDRFGVLALIARLTGPHLVEGHDVLIGADKIAPLAQVADANVAVAVVGQIDFEGGHSSGDEVGVDADARPGRIRGDGAVQYGCVGGVNSPLQGLQPVAYLPVFGYMTVGFRYLRPLKIRRRRPFARLAHIGPDDAALLQCRVGGNAYFTGIVAARRFVHHIQAVAVYVELPTVVHAAESALFVASQEQGGQPVGAGLVQQPDTALGISKGHQVLAQQPYPDGRTVRRGQFGGQQGRNPVAAHHLAHRGALGGASERFIFNVGEHGLSPDLCYFPIPSRSSLRPGS